MGEGEDVKALRRQIAASLQALCDRCPYASAQRPLLSSPPASSHFVGRGHTSTAEAALSGPLGWGLP